MPKLLSVLIAAGLGLVATAGSASAQTNPYSGTGYDISYPNASPPQCSTANLPTGAFGIVGVNHGRPFTANSCFSQELSHAAAAGILPSVYINTAYSGAYRRNVTTDCAQQPQSMAWQIGCSEAETAFSYAGQPATGTLTMWWLDVETGNSWSSSKVGLNQDAINGAADFLFKKGFQVGVYSTPSMWATITGRAAVFTPTNTVATWLAGANGVCTSSFDGNTLWLSQGTNGFDFDNAC